MATGFSQFFSSIKVPVWPNNAIRWARLGDTGLKCQSDFIDLKKYQFSKVVQFDTLNKIYNKPRILKFDVDFGMLETVELNIDPQQYEQPFEATILELPDYYKKEYTLDDPLRSGKSIYPLFVASIWRKEIEMLSLNIFLSSTDIYSTIIGKSGHTLEEQLVGIDHCFIDSLPVSDEEKIAYTKILRAALNACMFATHLGITKSYIENEEHYRKIGRKPPHVYTMNSRISSESIEFDRGGWSVKPHWRKAHWRAQRYGPGLSLTKAVFIDAIFVNQLKVTNDTVNFG